MHGGTSESHATLVVRCSIRVPSERRITFTISDYFVAIEQTAGAKQIADACYEPTTGRLLVLFQGSSAKEVLP